MPFRDPEWEDFQRDCAFFPAYTDYIFGIDSRPGVADEPGLHPQIYQPPSSPPPPPPPRQRLQGLPPPVQSSPAHDTARNAIHTRSHITSELRPIPLLQHESSVESMQPTPCPAPRALLQADALPALLRPNELTADPQYSYIPPLERFHTNTLITRAWAVMKSDAIPSHKVKAMNYIRSVSSVAAAKRREYHDRETSRPAVNVPEQGSQGCNATAQAQVPLQPAPLHFRGLLSSMFQDDIFTVQEYAIQDVSQLPAYMRACLPRLWTCAELVMLGAPLTTPQQIQAAQRIMGFIFSVPPKWRRYLQIVLNGMIKLRNQGGDPMTLLDHLPRVEDVFGMQQEAKPR